MPDISEFSDEPGKIWKLTGPNSVHSPGPAGDVDLAPLGPVGDYAALADAAGKARQDANERFQKARADSETAALRELVFTAASYGVTTLTLEPSDQGDYMTVSEIEPEVSGEAEDYIGDAGSMDMSDYSHADWAGATGVEVTEFSHRDDQIRMATIDIAVAAEALIAAPAKPVRPPLFTHFDEVCEEAGLGVMVQVYEILSDRGEVDEATLSALTADDVTNHYYRIGAGIDDVERALLA